MSKEEIQEQGEDRRHMVSLTPWAFTRLRKLLHMLRAEVAAEPEKHPGYVGRGLTYSDVINLLWERTVSDAS